MMSRYETYSYSILHSRVIFMKKKRNSRIFLGVGFIAIGVLMGIIRDVTEFFTLPSLLFVIGLVAWGVSVLIKAWEYHDKMKFMQEDLDRYLSE